MITYKQISSDEVKVYLEGKYVGAIFSSRQDGIAYWQYWPKGPRAEGGLRYTSLTACKRSLEGE